MDVRYPIGAFQFDGELTREIIDAWIDDIEELPVLLKSAVQNLTDEQLDTPYRPDGWDSASGRSSCGRQSYECLYSYEMGIY